LRRCEGGVAESCALGAFQGKKAWHVQAESQQGPCRGASSKEECPPGEGPRQVVSRDGFHATRGDARPVDLFDLAGELDDKGVERSLLEQPE
jgi:hypothetical protein